MFIFRKNKLLLEKVEPKKKTLHKKNQGSEICLILCLRKCPI